MQRIHWVVVCDRGGHYHNAKMLLEQMGHKPEALLITWGPEYLALKKSQKNTFRLPTLFFWLGKRRVLNPIQACFSLLHGFFLSLWLRPRFVISLGASNVIPFCFWAKIFGGKVFHVECMNQVETPSLTGRMLAPFSEAVFVQWPEMKKFYGNKARYAGWVL